jgi:hypothetical protein
MSTMAGGALLVLAAGNDSEPVSPRVAVARAVLHNVDFPDGSVAFETGLTTLFVEHECGETLVAEAAAGFELSSGTVVHHNAAVHTDARCVLNVTRAAIEQTMQQADTKGEQVREVDLSTALEHRAFSRLAADGWYTLVVIRSNSLISSLLIEPAPGAEPDLALVEAIVRRADARLTAASRDVRLP